MQNYGRRKMSEKWEELKNRGMGHYKTGKIEPIDLYKSAGILRHFAIGNIIKYAFRNADLSKPVNPKDIEKVKHYADMLLVILEEEKEQKPEGGK